MYDQGGTPCPPTMSGRPGRAHDRTSPLPVDFRPDFYGISTALKLSAVRVLRRRTLARLRPRDPRGPGLWAVGKRALIAPSLVDEDPSILEAPQSVGVLMVAVVVRDHDGG